MEHNCLCQRQQCLYSGSGRERCWDCVHSVSGASCGCVHSFYDVCDSLL